MGGFGVGGSASGFHEGQRHDSSGEQLAPDVDLHGVTRRHLRWNERERDAVPEHRREVSARDHAAQHPLRCVVLPRRGDRPDRVGSRAPGERGYALLALSFGLFYTALAVLGVVVYHPLGLRLDRGENVFHLIVGPITLALAAIALRVERMPRRAVP